MLNKYTIFFSLNFAYIFIQSFIIKEVISGANFFVEVPVQNIVGHREK